MYTEELFPDELLLFPVGFLSKLVYFVLRGSGKDRVSREDNLFLNPRREE